MTRSRARFSRSSDVGHLHEIETINVPKRNAIIVQCGSIEAVPADVAGFKGRILEPGGFGRVIISKGTNICKTDWARDR